MLNSKCKFIVGLLFVIATFVSTIGCNRIKSKGKEYVREARNEFHEQKENLVDKVFRQFDAYEADTKFNKLRFKEFFGVSITTDVKNIYCYGDEMGIDANHQFSFSCSSKTAELVKKTNDFSKDTLDESLRFSFQEEFDWWDQKKIETLETFSWTDGRQLYRYFWYDKKEQKAYYSDFDM